MAAALSGTTALAGCNTQSSTQVQNPEKEENAEPTATGQETGRTQTSDSEEENFSKDVFEQSLKALAYDLDEDLSYEGFESDSQKVELIGEEGDNLERDEGEYDLIVRLDSDSLLHGSGLVVGNQDFYTAARVGAVYDIFEDGKDQLNETTSIISERFEEFSNETEVPEDYNIGVRVNFEGARGSSIDFRFKYGRETVEEATEEFLDEVKTDDEEGEHSVAYHPGEYEDLALLEEGDSLTFHITDGET